MFPSSFSHPIPFQPRFFPISPRLPLVGVDPLPCSRAESLLCVTPISFLSSFPLLSCCPVARVSVARASVGVLFALLSASWQLQPPSLSDRCLLSLVAAAAAAAPFPSVRPGPARSLCCFRTLALPRPLTSSPCHAPRSEPSFFFQLVV